MSWAAMAWAIRQKLRTADKFALLMLAYRENPDTEIADVTMGKLAADCGMSRSGLKLAIQRLVDAGLVSVQERRIDTDRNLPNLYRLNYEEGGRGHEVEGRGHEVTPGRGHEVTPKAGSDKDSSTSRARLDFSTWPSEPSAKHLAGWIALRKQKRAPVTEIVMEAMGKALHEAKAIGWSVDEVLAECCNRGWQGFRVGWLEPKNGKPPPVRAGASSEPPSHGRHDYAQGGSTRNGGSRPGGAIDRVLGNAARRAEAAATTDGPGLDLSDDDVGVRAPVDVDSRR